MKIMTMVLLLQQDKTEKMMPQATRSHKPQKKGDLVSPVGKRFTNAAGRYFPPPTADRIFFVADLQDGISRLKKCKMYLD
jgi:hypothetical protein